MHSLTSSSTFKDHWTFIFYSILTQKVEHIFFRETQIHFTPRSPEKYLTKGNKLVEAFFAAQNLPLQNHTFSFKLEEGHVLDFSLIKTDHVWYCKISPLKRYNPNAHTLFNTVQKLVPSTINDFNA
jgi:hypothetical protein